MTDSTHSGPQDPSRRRALSCLSAWSGAAVLWGISGGVPRALGMASDPAARAAAGRFSFAQISDTHVGFNKDANPDVIRTMQRAIADINALEHAPAFVAHTGDITHLSKPEEFDLAEQTLRGLKVTDIHYVPGEHDALDEGLTGYLRRYGRGNTDGYYSFDQNGAHFVSLVNVVDFKAGSLASLGAAQLEWLKRDLAGRSASMPIVVLAHIPLWTVSEKWGWGTSDSGQALTYLRRFGSVTVLNGHIHQALQKVEGNVTFHSALSTAYPQPQPGTAEQPGPLKVPAGELGKLLGTREIVLVRGQHHVATIDTPIERAGQVPDAAASGAAAAAASAGARTTSTASGSALVSSDASTVEINGFEFKPQDLTVAAGSTVMWTNKDDTAHSIVARGGAFSSKGLDTGDGYAFTFSNPGDYPYFCSLHPHMIGTIHVRAR